MQAIFDVESLVSLGRVTAVAVTPDGRRAVACVQAIDGDGAAYVSSLWEIPMDGSTASLLLPGAFDDRAPAFRHDGVLTFLSNRTDEAHSAEDTPDDAAKTQVWACHDDGRLERLTHEPLGVAKVQWARTADVGVIAVPVWPGVDAQRQLEVDDDLKKGPSILRYTSIPVRYWDQWVGEKTQRLVALTAEGRVELTPDRIDAHPEFDWHLSADGRAVVYSVRGEGVQRLWATSLVVVDLGTGHRTELGVGPDFDLSSARLSPDGSTVAAVRTRWVQGQAWDAELVLIPRVGGEPKALAGDWDVHPNLADWSADGGSLWVTAAVRAHDPLFAVDVGTGARSVLVDEGTVVSVAEGDGVLVVIHSDLLHPPAPRLLSLHTGDHRPLASPDPLDVDLAEHLEVEDRTCRSPDGTQVQYRVVRPRGSGNGITLLWIHGGPISHWGHTWHWRWSAAVAAAAGYVVVLPNPRGSTGFGQPFVQGIWGNVWGAGCAADVLAVAADVAERDDVNPQRVVAMGGSFGGYMTNWLGTQTDQFAALVTHAALFDFRNFHGVTDYPPYWAWMFGFDPWKDADEMDRYSPRAHVDGWTTPTLILHGDKDYRVPIGEGMALFEALQARHIVSELVVFPDENHWILKPRNIVAWYEAWMGFVADRV
ncbi:MAG: prolyl oligopeptidase family serine peptidase [Myxococcota bacterium]